MKFKYGVYVTYDRGPLKSIRERISRHVSYSAADAAMVRAKRKYKMSCMTVSGESVTGMQNATWNPDSDASINDRYRELLLMQFSPHRDDTQRILEGKYI